MIEINTPKVKIESIEREGHGYNKMKQLDLEEEDIIQFAENHKRYKTVVKEILEYYPLATNNDFILFIEFLRVLDLCEVTSGKDNFVFKIPRDKIKHIPPPESCSRARRVLNSKGIGLPSNAKVFERRQRRQKSIRQYFKDQNKTPIK